VHTLKMSVIAMLAANFILLGMEASKAPTPPRPEPARAPASVVAAQKLVMRAEWPEASAEQPGQACFTVGPFEAGGTAQAVADLLSEHEFNSRARETVAFVDRGYWVYLPPSGDERAARETVQALYDAGLEDIALIRTGDWNLSISLGYFIRQQNALARREQVMTLGFVAKMRIQREDETRYWVDYQQIGADTSALMSDLVPAELHREIACGAADRPGTKVAAGVSETPALH